jgi:hypothetical protein
MNEEQRIKVLEEELKVLKNEVKTVLLDLREQYLNIQNPFNNSMAANTGGPQLGINPENGNGADSSIKDEPSNTDLLEEDEVDEEDEITSEDDDTEFNSPVTEIGIDNFAGGPTSDDSSFNDEFDSSGPQFGGLETSAISGPDTDNGSASSRPESRTEPVLTPYEYDKEQEDDIDEEPEIIEVKPAPTKNGKQKTLSLPTGNPKFDLVVIAGLTQWIDQATAKLGKERTEALVEMSCTMGRTPEHLKEVLIKMARLSPHESNGQPLKASDYLSILAQLENLLGESEIKDHALLSILSMMKESNDG